MKKIIFAIALMLSFGIQGQTVCIMPTKMNVLYRGMENPLQVTCATDRVDSVTAENAKIESHGYGYYTVTTDADPGSECYISAWVKGNMMSKMMFRVKNIPTPTAVINNKRNGDKMSVAEAKVSMGVVLILENFDFDLKIAVDEYEVVWLTKNGLRQQTMNTGAAFSSQSKNVMQKATVGDFYLFRNIKGHYPDGTSFTLPGFFIEIE